MITLDHPWTSDGQRRVFRHLFDAMARPGTIADIGAWCGGSRAGLAVLSTLCDSAASLHDAHALLADGDRSRLGAASAPPTEAAFVLADAQREPSGLAPQRGTLLSPERGATLILDCQAVGEGPALRLRGPGIDGTTELRVLGVASAWWVLRSAWCAPPVGLDLVLCDARRIACIPRSSIVES